MLRIKTAAYYRSSIESQENSIGTQRDEAKEAAIRNMIVIDEEYVDEAVSARTTDMKQRFHLNRLLREIKSGVVTTLLVYKRDRLARKVSEYMEIYELLKEKNVRVIFTARNELPIQYTPTGEFFELIIAGFNEREAKLIKDRIKQTKITMSREGKHPGGTIPYGYSVDKKDKTYIPIEEEIESIKQLYHLFVTTNFKSFSSFVRKINKENLFYKTDESWTDSKARTVLKDSFYKGIIQYIPLHAKEGNLRPEIYFLKKLEVIDNKTWKKAKVKWRRISRDPSEKEEEENEKWLLEGLVFCKKCERPMTINRKQNIYVCKHKTVKKQELETIDEAEMKEEESQLIDVYKVKRDKLENLVLVKASHYLSKFKHKLIERSFSQFRSEIKREYSQKEMKIKHLEGELHGKVEEWFANKKDEFLKEDLIKRSNTIRQLRSDYYKLLTKETALIELKNRMDGINKVINSVNLKNEKELIEDIIHLIAVSQNGKVDIFFKVRDEIENDVPVIKHA